MIGLRRSGERGYFDHGWLKSHHSFSFGDFYDPAHMSFRDLRVINEDIVEPSQGFGTHPHRDMEIITYIISGELNHKDSMGNGSSIRRGEIQYMSAGKGVTHSEFNASSVAPTHLLQIWIMPDAKGLDPQYGQIQFRPEDISNKLYLLLSNDGRNKSISIRQNVSVYASVLDKSATLEYEIAVKRHVWIQLISGRLVCNDQKLAVGDGAFISEEKLLRLNGLENNTEFLLFDLK